MIEAFYTTKFMKTLPNYWQKGLDKESLTLT